VTRWFHGASNDPKGGPQQSSGGPKASAYSPCGSWCSKGEYITSLHTAPSFA